MANHEEDDFELVLGDRQLFFLAVVLLGVFFSIGYTVGYGRGHDSGLSDLASATESSEPSAPGQRSPAEPVAIAGTASPEPAGAEAASGEVPLVGEASQQQTSTEPPATAGVGFPQVSGTAPSAAAGAEDGQRAGNAASSGQTAGSGGIDRPTPTSTPSAPSQREAVVPLAAAASNPPPAPSRPDSSRESTTPSMLLLDPEQAQPGAMFLQVFSARDLESAQKVYMQMRAKGHLAILDNLEPEYFRIVIGPFPTRQAADEYLQRLRGDGIESFLRRF